MHVRFPHYFLLQCLLDFELARKLLQAEHTTILDSSNERLISRLPKHEIKKNDGLSNTVREETGFWGLCVALSPS